MVRIRITAPCTTAKLDLRPGDEILVKTVPPGLQTLLNARRLDGEPVAEVVRSSGKPEVATTRNRTPETANA